MIVRLHEIGERSAQFDFQLARRNLKKLDDRFEFEWMNCRATLYRNKEVVTLQGNYQIDISTSCDLCLISVSLNFDREFELNLIPEESQMEPEGDVEITMDSAEKDYYLGDEIHLSQYFEDQLLLDLPYTISCSEDCKGMCSTCGANRNSESCDCSQKTGSHPFAVLKELKHDP